MSKTLKAKFRRGMIGGLLMAAGGYTFQIGTGCASFGGEQVLIATDFCFIFDCNNGAFGGLIQPCRGAATVTAEGDVVPGRSPLFVDCINVQP
jgi:hypothetical protein